MPSKLAHSAPVTSRPGGKEIVSGNMTDYQKYQPKSSFPDQRAIEKAAKAIEGNLSEMFGILEKVTLLAKSEPADQRALLCLGSHLFDFYLLAEDSLLYIARLKDRWIPASLDWHARLIKLLQSPVPDQRLPVISTQTAALLQSYLSFYLNFHDHAPKLTKARIDRLVADLPLLCNQLSSELDKFTSP